MSRVLTYARLMCFLLFSYLSIGLWAQNQDLGPLVTVVAEHTEYLDVDEIHFTINLSEHDLDIADARAKTTRISQEIKALLKRSGVDDRFIQTRRAVVSRNYLRRSQSREYDGFVSTQSIYVCLKAVGSYDDLMDALLLMNVESISTPSYKSSQEEAARQRARVAALKKAQKMASEWTEALDQSIGPAKQISQADYQRSHLAYGERSVDSGVAAESISLGEISVKASVKVSFALLD